MGGTPLDIRVVVLAGGQGTRFWPVSRRAHPKQFLSVSSTGESLIQSTVKRIASLAESDIIVQSHIQHQELIREHVPNCHLISEPFARNTAAAIGLAALHVQRMSETAVMVLLPADHAVKNDSGLCETLAVAAHRAASKDVLVTIGIVPSFPHTGYGYIQKGKYLGEGQSGVEIHQVKRFHEKPNLERANEYFESDNFFWNSGMFVWRPQVLLAAVQEYMPELYNGLMTIEGALGTPEEETTVHDVFEKLESISIDFGVMEHARNCIVVSSSSFEWSDVGSWDAWAEHFKKDDCGNVVLGDVLMIESSGSIVYAKDRPIAVLGADNLVVIDSGDAVLVCPRDRVQDVKKVVVELKKKGREDLV